MLGRVDVADKCGFPRQIEGRVCELYPKLLDQCLNLNLRIGRKMFCFFFIFQILLILKMIISKEVPTVFRIIEVSTLSINFKKLSELSV